MTTYSLTTNNDAIAGTANDDIIEAYADAATASPQSTLNAGDVISGGGGYDTLVLDGESTGDGGANTAIQGSITGVEKLVVIGTLEGGEDKPWDDSVAPLNVGRIGGLQAIFLQSGADYGLPDADGGTPWLANIGAGQTVTADEPLVAATLDYRSSVLNADLVLSSNDYVAAFELGGAKMRTINLDVQGAHDHLVNLASDAADGGSPKATQLNIDAEQGRVVVADGFLYSFIQALFSAQSGDDETVSGPPGIGTLTNVTVTGTGGAWVDLSSNTANVTFTGSTGKDAVLVDPDHTNSNDHFDGGAGTDIFAVTLLDTPASKTTLTVSTAAYAAFNSAERFEEAGFIGDFSRELVIDAGRVASYKTLVIGQDAQIRNLSDAQTVVYQLASLTSDLVLGHAVDASGAMTGSGKVALKGGDVLATNVLLSKLFGEDLPPSTGTVVLDNKSRYAALDLTGSVNVDVESASTWKDTTGALHGVTIDGSHSTGALHVAAGTTKGDTILGGARADVLDGGAGSDVLTGNGGKDVFLFNTKLGASNIDTITDMTAGTDKIELDRTILSALNAGLLGTAAFSTGTAATTAADHIIYNAASGALLYDADGNGKGAAVQFATVGHNLTLASSDFRVV